LQSEINTLAGDTIANYKTVQSLGHEEKLFEKLNEMLTRQKNEEVKKSHVIAIAVGFGVAIQNVTFGILYLVIAELHYYFPHLNYADMFLAMFAVIFGGFSAAQASSMGPDLAKGIDAAEKIFKIVDTPSEINAIEDDLSKKSASHLKGEIEFRDVWFRYPQRLEQWVFKGLNLKINQNDTIAVVGESGQGKSTLISLIMRFYDPEFG